MNFFKIDKIHHIVYSYALCVTLCLILSFLKTGLIIAFIATMFIGIAKEIYDKNDPQRNAEWNDIIADLIGAILAVVIFGVCSLLWF